MSKLAGQWIDLFRAGDYTDVGKDAFTLQDLDTIVNNYDPADYEAPSTIGHPKPNDSAPAYGWWSKLRRVGDRLQGQMSTVQPEFEEGLERGLWKKRSAGLMKRAKGWTLHHVAWLGAQAPQVKGLADLKFEDEGNVIEIDFSEETDMALTEDDKKALGDSLWERIKGLLPSKDASPADTAKTFSEEDARRIAGEAAASVQTAMQAKLDTLTQQFSEREKTLATSETKQRAAAAIASLKAKGVYVPAFDKMGLPQIFEELATRTELVEFGEGDKVAKKPAVDVLAEFMEGLKQLVPNSPVWTGQKPSSAPTGAVQFNETARTPADANSVELDRLAKAKQAADPKLSYGAALNMAAAEKPELTQPGGASGGSV